MKKIYQLLLVFINVFFINYNSNIFSMNDAFNLSKQQKDCCVCLDKKDVKDFVSLECKHEYCCDCLKSMIDIALKEKRSVDLKCIDRHCNKQFTEKDLRKIFSDQKTIDEIATIRTKELLSINPNAKHCPTPNCSYIFLNEDNSSCETTCPLCNDKYCSNCLVQHSARLTCQQAAALRPEDKETEEWLRQHKIKPCPKCNYHIERYEGCDYVTCSRCQQGFCFNCYGDHHVGRCDRASVYLREQQVSQVTIPINRRAREQDVRIQSRVNPAARLRMQQEEMRGIEVAQREQEQARQRRVMVNNQINITKYEVHKKLLRQYPNHILRLYPNGMCPTDHVKNGRLQSTTVISVGADVYDEFKVFIREHKYLKLFAYELKDYKHIYNFVLKSYMTQQELQQIIDEFNVQI